MKTNLNTFPLKAKTGLIFLQGWEDASHRQFYLNVDKWIRDFEVELRKLREKLASRGYDGIDIVIIDQILGEG